MKFKNISIAILFAMVLMTIPSCSDRAFDYSVEGGGETAMHEVPPAPQDCNTCLMALAWPEPTIPTALVRRVA